MATMAETSTATNQFMQNNFPEVGEAKQQLMNEINTQNNNQLDRHNYTISTPTTTSGNLQSSVTSTTSGTVPDKDGTPVQFTEPEE